MTPLTPMWIYAILLCSHHSISSKLWFTFLEVPVILIQVFFCTKCCFTSWFKDKIHLITINHIWFPSLWTADLSLWNTFVLRHYNPHLADHSHQRAGGGGGPMQMIVLRQ